MIEETQEEPENRHKILEKEKEKGKADHLQPWQYKKGQSGNPSGRPKGISLKEYARNKLLTMTDEEREEFFHGLPKVEIWKLAEGNAETKTDITSGGKSIVIQIPEVVSKRFDLNDTTNTETDGVPS